jgi:hypothetical protein
MAGALTGSNALFRTKPSRKWNCSIKTEQVQLPFVWVSPPIDAGFFAYDVPEHHEQPGHLTAAVIGRDADGNVIAHYCLLLSPDQVDESDPAVVAVCKSTSLNPLPTLPLG